MPAELSQAFDELFEKSLEKTISIRTFDELRSLLFECLKKVGKEVDKNSFSKHWWHNYRQKHPRVKEKWAAMPLKRTVKKGPIAEERWRKKNEEKRVKLKNSKDPMTIEEEEAEAPTTNYQSPISQDTMKYHGIEPELKNMGGYYEAGETVFEDDEENFYGRYGYEGPSSDSFSREDEEDSGEQENSEEEIQKEENFLPIESFFSFHVDDEKDNGKDEF